MALKAGVLNLLSIGAAYGVVSLVAEGGWAGQLVGIDTDLPVPPFIPVMMFAVLFGLSMDYEVFLLSRIKEELAKGGDARMAVVAGVARTAKVITAAAAIMIAVFAAFALSPEVFLKLIGIGLATAILVDATIVRMILVPAIMELLGEKAWWAPRWLKRLIPRSTSKEQRPAPPSRDPHAGRPRVSARAIGPGDVVPAAWAMRPRWKGAERQAGWWQTASTLLPSGSRTKAP